MSEIEAKRKELEDYFGRGSDEVDLFNQGVEMARKEILPKIKEVILWARQWAEHVEGDEILECWDKGILLEDFFSENSRFSLTDFKQSIEEEVKG